MNIRAKQGDKVRYCNFNCGRISDLAECDRYLYRGCVYTVERTVVHGFHTEVFLQEVEGIGFNSVMFESAVPPGWVDRVMSRLYAGDRKPPRGWSITDVASAFSGDKA